MTDIPPASSREHHAADALGLGVNALTIHGFDPLRPEFFFLAYGAVALLAGLAVMAARKPLIRLARGAL
ncbi:MAG: hypothetical protein LBK54_06405 [Propionibacteriaceae bacterium]|jgi:hypothetical protein|nr:hypothetical protein [Propionibacteriaceae bacterium]